MPVPNITVEDENTNAPTSPRLVVLKEPDLMEKLLMENRVLKAEIERTKQFAAEDIKKSDDLTDGILKSMAKTFNMGHEYDLRRIASAQDENMALKAQAQISDAHIDDLERKLQILELEHSRSRSSYRTLIEALRCEKGELSKQVEDLGKELVFSNSQATILAIETDRRAQCEATQTSTISQLERANQCLDDSNAELTDDLKHADYLLEVREREIDQLTDDLKQADYLLEVREREIDRLNDKVQDFTQERAAIASIIPRITQSLGQIERGIALRQAQTDYITGLLGRKEYDLIQSKAYGRHQANQAADLRLQLEHSKEALKKASLEHEDFSDMLEADLNELLDEARVNQVSALEVESRQKQEIADYKDYVALLEQLKVESEVEAEQRPSTAEKQFTGLQGFIGLGQPGYVRQVANAWSRRASSAQTSRPAHSVSRGRDETRERVAELEASLAELKAVTRDATDENEHLRNIISGARQIVMGDTGPRVGLQ